MTIAYKNATIIWQNVYIFFSFFKVNSKFMCGYKSRAVIITKFIFKIPFSAVINRVRLILMSDLYIAGTVFQNVSYLK